MVIAAVYGTATINATLGAGGIVPSVTITSTVTHTTSYQDIITPQNIVRDVEGIIGLSKTRLNATQIRVSADRQLPAGEEIVFDWGNINGSA